MLAVTNGNSELAQVLVDHDAQVDCTDKHLRTALHRAVSNVRCSSVAICIAHALLAVNQSVFADFILKDLDYNFSSEIVS